MITLSSSNSTAASVPSTVTVAPGATISSPFTITTGAMNSSLNVTLSAKYASVVQTAKFNVRPALLYGVYIAPATISGGLSTTANEVGLYGFASGPGAVVSLQSSNPAVASVPASVLVAAGTNVSPHFTISTMGVSTPTTVSISATYAGITKSASLTITPASVSQLTFSAKGVQGGHIVSSNTVSMLGQASSGGDVITLSSSNPGIATVPSTVTVPAGSSISQAFSITTSTVGVSTVVTISAAFNGITKVANLTIVPATVYQVDLSASTVTGGTSVKTNRIILTGPAPAGGLVIALSSSDPSVASLPQTVAVAAGSNYSAQFALTTTAVTTSTPVTISASYGTANVSAVLTVTP